MMLLVALFGKVERDRLLFLREIEESYSLLDDLLREIFRYAYILEIQEADFE